MERRAIPPASRDVQSRDIFDLEDEMKELIGYLQDVVMVLSCVDENSLVITIPYRFLMSCERVMERLDEICQEMVKRLIRKERTER